MLLDCIVLGDSIAVGVGQARPECKVMAATGITSERYVELLPMVRAARTAIISLGVNDGPGMDTVANLRRLRGTVRATTVYWMLVGSNPQSRVAARAVAAQYGDRLIDVAPLAGPDHIHPDRTGYAKLASLTHGGGTGLTSGGGASLPHGVGRSLPHGVGVAGGAANRSQALAYHDFQAPQQVYRAFPNLRVWNGPDNLNGTTIARPTRP